MSRIAFPRALEMEGFVMCSTLFLTPLLTAGLFFGTPDGSALPKRAESAKTVTYAVSDLVIPISQAPCEPEESSESCGPNESLQSRQALEEKLIKLITSTISPASWCDMGGEGTINYFPLGMALVVRQTPEIHEQIADLLVALRRLQDLEVSVEVRLVSVTQEFFNRLGKDVSVTFDPVSAVVEGAPCLTVKSSEGHGISKFKGMSFLDDKQLKQFMNGVQEDRKACIMQAPKLTVFNGQRANINVTEERSFVTDFKVIKEGAQVVVVPKNETFTTGVRFQVQPVISADRRYVAVNFSAKLTDLDADVPVVPVTTHLVSKVDSKGKERVVPVQQFVQQPTLTTMSVRKSFVVADGKTAVLNWGTRMEEARCETPCPAILDQIPYVGQLFSNSGNSKEAHVLLLLVTPRVIVNEDGSQEYFGELSRIPR
jgi:type II secretory pathway component GspD/PulD (secretin)